MIFVLKAVNNIILHCKRLKVKGDKNDVKTEEGRFTGSGQKRNLDDQLWLSWDPNCLYFGNLTNEQNFPNVRC